ncbi:MAG: hypothetical protein ABI148_05370 [Ginsengibacter sp.]
MQQGVIPVRGEVKRRRSRSATKPRTGRAEKLPLLLQHDKEV